MLEKYFDEIVQAYWIMCDGSFNNEMILHTQTFNHKENIIQASRRKTKWNLETTVIPHKSKECVALRIPSRKNKKLRDQISSYMIEQFKYKIP